MTTSGGASRDRHARLSQECRRQRLERRYRRLLVLYPKKHRHEHADEMIGVLLSSAFETRVGSGRLGHWADMADLVVGAARIRSRIAVRRLRHRGPSRGIVRDRRWCDALAVASVVAPLLLLVAALAQFNIPQAAASTVSGQPYWPLSGPLYVPDWPLTIGAPLVLVLAFCRMRRLGGLVALGTAVSQLFLPPTSYASPALAFSVLVAASAGAALLLSPGTVRGFALLRWWGTALIGVVALILGGFTLGDFSLSGYLPELGGYASAVPGSYPSYAVFQPTEIAGFAGDMLIAGVLAGVSIGCLFTPTGRRVLALFAIPMIPYAYMWTDKLGTDLIWQLGGITAAIQSSAPLLYLPSALVACMIVAGTRLARRRAGSAATGRAVRYAPNAQ